MKTRTFIIILAGAFLVMALCSTAGMAGRPVLPSNETSRLAVEISASAEGSLRSNTDLVLNQGNGNLADNPPLDSNGEGQATIGYFEKTTATSGSIEYNKDLYVDTSGQTQPQNNLETVRSIDYTNDGDGNGVGRMVSTEAVLIDECATSETDEIRCCPWPADGAETNPATCVNVITGSEVDLKEGSVNSESSARIIAEDADEGIQVSYDVTVDGSGQTGNETAEGKAEVYTEAIIKEGSGSGTNMTTDMSYEESVTVDGLIEIAMRTGYSSP